MTNEEKITRYLRKIAENTDRIAKALEAMNNPRRIVEGALKREPEDSDREKLDEMVARAIVEGDE